jgi:hypothetical protein
MVRREMDDWDRETMVLGIQSMRDAPLTEYTAPGAEQKWRARDLVDIHWKLVGEDPPSESYNRIMSCIIGHANPTTGRCQLKQKLIATETGYSRDTVTRAVNWWEAKGFLIRQNTGRARSNAYHPQWLARMPITLNGKFSNCITSPWRATSKLKRKLGSAVGR